MIKDFHLKFKQLPDSTKSMVYIMWLYFFWQVVANVFIWIYIYNIWQSFFDIALYNILLFTWAFSAFVWFWLSAWINKWNIKNFYYWSYFAYILSFLTLLFYWDSVLWVYVFWIIYWAWIWLYYNAVHTQELKNINKSLRNHYSSSVTIWKNIIESLFPLVLAGIFFIWTQYSLDIYPILFILLIIIYLVGLLKIKSIDDYYPEKITKKDFMNFCNLSKYKYWHLYFLNNWITHILYTVCLSIIAIYFLKNEVNIWLMQWILAIVWTILIIYISVKRDENNLFYYFSLFSFLILLNCIIFSFNFSFYGYLTFLLVFLILLPLYRVSEHIYDLATMDNVKTLQSDFYPAMVFREIILWIWRIIAFWILYYLFDLYSNNIEFLIQIILIIIWISYITQVWLIYMWNKYEKNWQ